MAAQLSEQDYDGGPKSLSLLKLTGERRCVAMDGTDEGDGLSQIARTGSRRSLMY